MALGPKIIQDNSEEIVEKLEKIIDEYIEKSEKNFIFINCENLPGIFRVRDKIYSMYEKVGWEVTIYQTYGGIYYLSMVPKNLSENCS